jgi:peptidoglycan-N-acetylglucosamine deacetylase
MMTKFKIIIFSVLISLSITQAQDKFLWNNKKCAVSLTYDDALNVHLDNVVPLLDSVGIKGTFYLSAVFSGFKERAKEWALVGKKGHELGNHTLFHPCDGKFPGRKWVKPEFDINIYTTDRIVEEIKIANILYEALDGKSLRTFAYPCGDMKAGSTSYVDKIKEIFIAARGVEAKMQKADEIDLYNIGCYLVNGQSGDELISLVKQSMEKGALLVFLFHGVGGEHSLNVSLDSHRKLIRFLKQNEQDIWVAPLVEIAKEIKNRR